MTRTGSLGRQERLQDMIRIVESAGRDGISVENLQSILDLKFGVTRRVVASYLKTASQAGLIENHGVKWYYKTAPSQPPGSEDKLTDPEGVLR